MATQGPNSPSTMADDATIGGSNWGGTTGNVGALDGIYASNTLGVGQLSTFIKTTNFGFSIPTGATINGIVVEISGKCASGVGTYGNVRIVKGGTISTTNLSGTTNAIISTQSYQSLGNSTNLWGETWTVDDINASTFGVVVSITDTDSAIRNYQVDHIRITVYYTDAITGNNLIALGVN